MLGALARHASPVLLGLLGARVSHHDRRVLRNREFRAVLAASMRESFRGGYRGAITELKLLSTAWGFDLSALSAPVHIWHGGKDRVVPISMGRFLERTLRNCQASYAREHGHYSLVHDCAEQILAHLTRRSPTQPSC